MPRRTQVTEQPRWPGGTPGGLGGQWRPDFDLDSLPAAYFLGVAWMIDHSPNKRENRKLLKALNKRAGERHWTGEGNRDSVVMKNMIMDEVTHKLDPEKQGELLNPNQPPGEITHTARGVGVAVAGEVKQEIPETEAAPIIHSPMRTPKGRLKRFGSGGPTTRILKIKEEMEQDDHGDIEGLAALNAELVRRGMSPVPVSVPVPVSGEPQGPHISRGARGMPNGWEEDREYSSDGGRLEEITYSNSDHKIVLRFEGDDDWEVFVDGEERNAGRSRQEAIDEAAAVANTLEAEGAADGAATLPEGWTERPRNDPLLGKAIEFRKGNTILHYRERPDSTWTVYENGHYIGFDESQSSFISEGAAREAAIVRAKQIEGEQAPSIETEPTPAIEDIPENTRLLKIRDLPAGAYFTSVEDSLTYVALGGGEYETTGSHLRMTTSQDFVPPRVKLPEGAPPSGRIESPMRTPTGRLKRFSQRTSDATLFRLRERMLINDHGDTEGVTALNAALAERRFALVPTGGATPTAGPPTDADLQPNTEALPFRDLPVGTFYSLGEGRLSEKVDETHAREVGETGIYKPDQGYIAQKILKPAATPSPQGAANWSEEEGTDSAEQRFLKYSSPAHTITAIEDGEIGEWSVYVDGNDVTSWYITEGEATEKANEEKQALINREAALTSPLPSNWTRDEGVNEYNERYVEFEDGTHTIKALRDGGQAMENSWSVYVNGMDSTSDWMTEDEAMAKARAEVVRFNREAEQSVTPTDTREVVGQVNAQDVHVGDRVRTERGRRGGYSARVVGGRGSLIEIEDERWNDTGELDTTIASPRQVDPGVFQTIESQEATATVTVNDLKPNSGNQSLNELPVGTYYVAMAGQLMRKYDETHVEIVGGEKDIPIERPPYRPSNILLPETETHPIPTSVNDIPNNNPNRLRLKDLPVGSYARVSGGLYRVVSPTEIEYVGGQGTRFPIRGGGSADRGGLIPEGIIRPEELASSPPRYEDMSQNTEQKTVNELPVGAFWADKEGLRIWQVKEGGASEIVFPPEEAGERRADLGFFDPKRILLPAPGAEPAPEQQRSPTDSEGLAVEIVAKARELGVEGLEIKRSKSNRYARILAPGRAGRMRVLAYVRAGPRGNQITYTRGTPQELQPPEHLTHSESDAIGVRGEHYAFPAANADAEQSAAVVLQQAAQSGTRAGAHPQAGPSVQQPPPYQAQFHNSAEDFANYIVAHANAQLPESDTSGFTVEVPTSPQSKYARIVYAGKTIAYVKPDTDETSESRKGIPGRAIHHRVTFVKGSEDTITRDLVRDRDSAAASVKNGLTVKVELPVAQQNDEDAKNVARNLLLARSEPQRKAPGRASPSREPTYHRGSGIIKTSDCIWQNGWGRRETYQGQYEQGGTPGMNAGEDNKPAMPNGGRGFGVEIEMRIEPHLSTEEITQILRDNGIPCDDHDNSYGHGNNLRAFSISGDPTISGFELGVPPLKGPEGEALLNKVIEILREHGAKQGIQGGYSPEGTHVHVDARDFDAQDIREVKETWENNRRIIDTMIAPSRRSVSWAGGRSNLAGSGHEYAVNLEHVQEFVRENSGSGTIEFRRLGSNILPKELDAWTNFVKAIVQYSRDHDGGLPSFSELSGLLNALDLDPQTKAVLLKRAERVARRE